MAKISAEKLAMNDRRRAANRLKWQERFRRWSWYAVLAEVFFLALSPTLATIALLVGIVLTFMRARTDADFHFRHLALDVPVGLFIVISAASILVSPDRGFSFYNWYNLVGVYVLTYFLVGQQVRSAREVRQVLLALGAAAVLVTLYGFYQFIFGIDISAMKWVDGEAFPELRKRVFSTWENPNILAGYLDIVICLAFGLFVQADSKPKRIVLGALILAAAACLGMTYARGACLVIAVIFVLYGMLKDWRVLVACVVIGAVLLIADPVLYTRLTSVFTTIDTSAEMRLAFWESTIAMIQDHPFLGIGWGAFFMVYPEYDFYLQGADILIVHAHNLYLNYAAEIGIPGALAFMWFFCGTMYLALRARFAPPVEPEREPTPFDLKEESEIDAELKSVTASVESAVEAPRVRFADDIRDWADHRVLTGAGLGLGLAVISIALNGFTDDLLFNIPSSMLLWLMAATAAALYELAQAAEPTENDHENEGDKNEGTRKHIEGNH